MKHSNDLSEIMSGKGSGRQATGKQSSGNTAVKSGKSAGYPSVKVNCKKCGNK